MVLGVAYLKPGFDKMRLEFDLISKSNMPPGAPGSSFFSNLADTFGYGEQT